MKTVGELMTRNVHALSLGDTLATAHRHMKEHHIRHLPVIDKEGHLIGLLTHRMVLAAWVGHFDPMQEKLAEVAEQIPVEMVMQKNVITVPEELLASEAAAVMETRQFGCVPVVSHGKLVGILTETDFLRYARKQLAGQLNM
jgi:CBS domain-containing protein